jgi:large subunit ribosomal protein L25
MAQPITLKADVRDIKGKKVKNLRKKGFLPAVLYGHDIKSQSLVVPYNDFEKVYNETGGSALVLLNIDNKSHNVLINEVELEPISQKYLHADFYAVKMTEKITAEVPFHFIGESSAVEEKDGVLVKNMDTVEVSCLPTDLPQSIEIDISVLKDIDDVIHIGDLKPVSGVEVLKDKDEVIVNITPPRTEEELAELEEEVSKEEEAEEVEKVESETEKEAEEEAEGEEGKEGKEESLASEPEGEKKQKKE